MAELHIPCAVNEVIGTSQLIQRIEMGVSPSVMLKSAPSKKVAKEMSNLLKGMSPGQMVAFDVGEINDKKDLGPIIEYIADTLQKHPGRVAPEMGAKASSAIGYEKYTGVYAPYSLEEFKGAQKNNLDAMGKVQEQLERHGIILY